jgi:hypothetical protein
MMYDDATKHAIDYLAAGIAVASIAELLPAVASVFTIIWLGLRIFESRTVQGWLGRKPPKDG